MTIHETVRRAQDTLAHFRGMYMRDSLHDYCRQFVDYMRPYNNIRMERGGRLWWTASEKPLVPPASFGELCIEEEQARLSQRMSFLRFVTGEWGRGAYVPPPQDFSRDIDIDDICALRIAMYHKEKA